MAKDTYIVAGSGFRAFCDALFLSSLKDSKVIILDSSNRIGNVMYSREVKGFAVDNGVHMFDSIPEDLAKHVTEIMEGNVIDIDFVSESAFFDKVTEGFSLPDLNSLDDKSKSLIKNQLLALSQSKSDPNKSKNVKEFFENRYGSHAANIFIKIFKKLYSVDPQEIDPTAVSQTSLARMKFLSDEEMIKLKNESTFLDSVLAARRKSQGKIDDFVSIYPSTNEGMRGWCIRAEGWLKKRGIELCLGEDIQKIEINDKGVKVITSNMEVDANKIIWSSDNFETLANSVGIQNNIDTFRHKVSMIFITLITQQEFIKDFTYLQNFNLDGICQRFAAAGLYSNQIKDDGTSFVTCECPAEVDGEIWNSSETIHLKVWEEAKKLGVINPEATLIDFDTIKVPTTIKMPKVGFYDELKKFSNKIKSISPNIIFRDHIPFFRREIYLESLKLDKYL